MEPIAADRSSSSSEHFSSQSPSLCSSPRPNSQSPNTLNPNAPLSPPPLNQALDDPKSPHQLVQVKLELEESPALPKLRLNAILASDPALQPYAKDIKQPPEPARLDDDSSTMPIISGLHHEPRLMALPSAESFVAANFAELMRRDGILAKAVPNAAAAAGYTCEPCGIKFSSLSTLEAHQTYYCSHNRTDGGGVDAKATMAKAGVATQQEQTVQEPPTKVSRMGKQYACAQCSYSADKKVSLNRHMRMHQSSPAASSGASNCGDPTADVHQQVMHGGQHQPTDCYCTECDIRFSNLKTYQAHKQHYCSERHRDG